MTIPSLPSPSNKLLSIQSHVVHGYVGNKAATFPLQLLNWDVDVLNTVNFSNHTGYGKVSGEVVQGDQLKSIYSGLKEINMRYDAILTGYIHGAESVNAVGEMCIDIKTQNPKTKWLLDPVMGDEGQLYVGEDVIPCYQNILKSQRVDIVTPNQFELELLLGFSVTDKESLQNAVQILHNDYKIKHVVISSLTVSAQSLGLTDEDSSEAIFCCVSSAGFNHLTVFKIAKLNSYFTGVGDLFSALLIDRLFKSDDLLLSTNQVLSIMSGVLAVTRSLSHKTIGKSVEGKIGDFETMKECELKIVECRELYGLNNCNYEAVELS